MPHTITYALSALIPLVYFYNRYRNSQVSALRGPPSPNLLYGTYKLLHSDEETCDIHAEWAKQYGSVYRIPSGFGQSTITLCDPRAVAHFYTEETWAYQKSKAHAKFIEVMFGKGLLWDEAEGHRRQRKALTPAFSNAAIRHLTSVFFDSAYKIKTSWDSIIDASTTSNSGTAVIEVQDWMNRMSLDSIGIAGFSHDFDSLSGASSPILDTLDELSSPMSNQSKVALFTFVLSLAFPILMTAPTKLNRTVRKLNAIMADIAQVLLERTRKSGSTSDDKSLIGLLIKAEDQDRQLALSEEEVLAQMNTLLFAGFETTSASLTWALIELCTHPHIQTRLRDELTALGPSDPTYEQLMSGIPFLDAVVHEVLRLHPPLGDTVRVATKDDVIPLAEPVLSRTGEWMSSLLVKKGEIVSVPIRYFNRTSEYWGPDASSFNPQRWLSEEAESPLGAKEVNGHRKLLSFSDGPRICLGKQFALVEFKAVLVVLIKNYEFAFEKGIEGTKIGRYASLMPRAKIEGEKGSRVPLLVRRLD